VKRSEPERPRLRHPLRDSAIFYAILALVIVLVAALTGGGLAKALVVGAAFFVAATAWSWWRYRERFEHERGR